MIDQKLLDSLAADARSVWKRRDLFQTVRIESHDRIKKGRTYEFYDVTSSMLYTVNVKKISGSFVYDENGIKYDLNHYEIHEIF